MAGRAAASADVPAPAAAAGAGIVAEGPPAVLAAGATIGASWAAPRLAGHARRAVSTLLPKRLDFYAFKNISMMSRSVAIGFPVLSTDRFFHGDSDSEGGPGP